MVSHEHTTTTTHTFKYTHTHSTPIRLSQKGDYPHHHRYVNHVSTEQVHCLPQTDINLGKQFTYPETIESRAPFQTIHGAKTVEEQEEKEVSLHK